MQSLEKIYGSPFAYDSRESIMLFIGIVALVAFSFFFFALAKNSLMREKRRTLSIESIQFAGLHWIKNEISLNCICASIVDWTFLLAE